MADDPPDRTLSSEEIGEMVGRVRPEWTVRDATLAESGYAAVYRLAVETPDGARECVLKASPDGDSHGIDAEARLLGIVAERTAIPVPEVLGVVDACDDIRTPFFLMKSMSGTEVPPEDVGALSDDVLRHLARQTGEYLGQLHAIDAVDEFGLVGRDPSNPLSGGRPSADPAQLTVHEGANSWSAVVRTWADRALDRAAETRFADLTPALRAELHERIDALAESAETASAVLARIDHGLHNLLLEPESGRIDAVLDWAFTLATPPRYDLACVEYVLSGGDLLLLPDQRDRRELVRDGLRSGYRSSPSLLPPEDSERRALYRLLAYARSTHHLESGRSVVPDERVDASAEGLRREIRTLLDGGR